jgi:ABC-type transport system involved in multi-copper enzyme maturation permease subunit
MITSIVLGILGILILILILMALFYIAFKLDNSTSTSNSDPNVPLHETKEFQLGLNHAFSLIQICLYKMWSDQDILDFDSINKDIQNNLINITKDPNDFNLWQNKYVEYLKNKHEEDKNDI